MVARTFRIALLLCDTPVCALGRSFYRDIFGTWLKGALATSSDPAIREDTQVVVDGYDVVTQGDYPPHERLLAGAAEGYDAIMLSGSKYTVHEMDPPFIPTLISWVRNVCTNPEYLHLKVVGICFGHQIIASAMGGKSERGDKGWEVGVYGASLSDEGKRWFCEPAVASSENDKIYLEQMHRDHVPRPPPGFITTLRTAKYPVQGMVKHHPLSTPQQPIAQIFTLQGHPEFTPQIVESLVTARIAGAIFDSDEGKEAIRRTWGKDRQGGEGLIRVGWSIWRLMLNRPAA
ncbi:class I glutamine amidotransferase-like protein [Naematelia encephala]|uniref:Class I glutamine amidotransferase-like protein n=1 Tax=Naematelia encephala TaxID=71784 RepID=A0A1Y2BDK2_9TREE|nr:class I glutamine amidotransferase-like protein [Naematelia encephala]